MIKRASALMLAVLAALTLAGCGGAPAAPASAAAPGDGEGRPSVICTIFPPYDWVREIAGERLEALDLTLLTSNGADMHSYQPSAADVVDISRCDLFIYVGGESDRWVQDALKAAGNTDMAVVNMLEVLGGAVKEETLKEGMQAEEADHEDAPEYDEHVWLSLKNAQKLCGAISEALCRVDPAGAEVYARNAEAYVEKLSRLDEAYARMAEEAARPAILVADRFPFRYLADDYGLDYYAAFPGCSAETEASFETVVFLAKKLDALSLNTVFILENSKKGLAETVISSTSGKNQGIAMLDSLQSVTAAQIAGGKTYLTAMEANLQALAQALG